MNAFFKLVLKGSAIGALSLVAVAAGCSDSSSDDNNKDAAGGDNSTTGGKNNTGGSNSQAGKDAQGGDNTGKGGDNTVAMGGSNGMGGDNTVVTMGGDKGDAGGAQLGSGGDNLGFGGQKGTGTGPSVAKFCNTLSFGNAETTMILEIGEGADKVSFTAATGECVPADGDACTEIPQGDAVSVKMFDMDDPNTSLDELVIGIGKGEELAFWTDLGDPDGKPYPIIQGQVLDPTDLACKDVTYENIP
jgi:hypothetical protein